MLFPPQQKIVGFNLPGDVNQSLTDAQRAIQFVRSTPGVTAALVGMSRREHVEENLETAARVAPMSFNDYRVMFASGKQE